MAEMITETERLILRRPRESDIDAWMAHINTPEVTQHLGGPRTREQVAEKFDRMARSWEAHGFSFLMLEEKASGTFLGTCGIGLIEVEHAPDTLRGAVQIGWQLRADYWGQGYALESARAMMGFGFGKTAIDTIYSQTALRNHPSWRLMEKLGMCRRPDLDYDDPNYPPADNPTIIYSLDRAEWRAQSGARAA
jgi:RimJ/RimL family protein N-acetyltransferase